MKIYTVLTSRNPAPLKQFAQTCVDCGATGVTVFTRPEMVSPVLPPGTRSQQELERDADAAAARKDYKTAAEIQVKIENLKIDMADAAKAGTAWVREALNPLRDICQLIVLTNGQWTPTTPFNTPNFLANLQVISNALLGVGIGGIVQKTPLVDRTFIPLADDGHAAQGEPERGFVHSDPSETPVVTPPAPTPTPTPMPTAVQPAAGDAEGPRHKGIPPYLNPKQAKYAEYRLGLDRGGARRTKQEAGNLLGLSPIIAGKMEAAVAAQWKEFVGMVNDNLPTGV